MVKHIVLFKLKENLSQEEKNEVMNSFKAAIEALPEKIDAGFMVVCHQRSIQGRVIVRATSSDHRQRMGNLG